MVFTLLTTGVFAYPHARSFEKVSTTFFPLMEFGWLGAVHWHNVGTTYCAASTLTPRAALTCACVRREHGSLGGAAYAARELQMLRVQRKTKATTDECFESTFHLRVGAFYTRI